MKKKQFSRWNTAVWVVALLVAVSFCACSSMEEKRDKFLASGQALYQQGDYVRARLQFQNALQIDPKFAAAYLWLGKTELKLQNPRGAYGALNQAVELNPNLTEAQVLLGDLLLMAKQLDKAKEKAEIALKQEPQNTDALMLSAVLGHGPETAPKSPGGAGRSAPAGPRQDLGLSPGGLHPDEREEIGRSCGHIGAAALRPTPKP